MNCAIILIQSNNSMNDIPPNHLLVELRYYHGYGYTWTGNALWAVFFGTTKKIVRLLYKLSNKYSNEKLFFIKVVSISRFHYKSFIKSLIFKIFLSAWSGRLAHKPAQTEMSANLSRNIRLLLSMVRTWHTESECI